MCISIGKCEKNGDQWTIEPSKDRKLDLFFYINIASRYMQGMSLYWNNGIWPATAEIQLGHNVRNGLAVYTDFLVGLGGDRPYDYGLGVGLRFNY